MDFANRIPYGPRWVIHLGKSTHPPPCRRGPPTGCARRRSAAARRVVKTVSLARREENLRGRNSQWNPMDMNDVFMYIYIYIYNSNYSFIIYIWVSNSCFMEFYGIEALTVMQMLMYRNVNGWWIDDGCIDTNIQLRKWMIHGESQWHLITVCHRWPPEDLGWTLHHSPSGSSHWGVSGLGAGKAYARNYPQWLTIWVFP